jgi:hypothetical protein
MEDYSPGELGHLNVTDDDIVAFNCFVCFDADVVCGLRCWPVVVLLKVARKPHTLAEGRYVESPVLTV